ncbi:MAG: pilus assembly PilX N-terminal domain-containing protein [Proteobacteria bacterium]|nr:pilus assembly PilX N-terminal domain-containing protein [Pseudomonadota bacterium]MCG2756924.1 pilus assembly PilX N-terminal domain-containing protein [Desulfobacteraceae bacterium]
MKIKKQVGTILSNEKGMVLPLGLIFLAIIAILGTTAVIMTTTDLKIGTNYKLSEQAFYVAEAGIQRAANALKAGVSNGFDDELLGADGSSGTSDDGILSFGSSVGFGGGTYAVQVTDNNDDGDLFSDSDKKVIITSTGIVNNASKTIEAVYYSMEVDVEGALGIYGNGPIVELSGASEIDGRDYNVPPDFDCSGAGCTATLVGGAPAETGIYAEEAITQVGLITDETDKKQNVFGDPPIDEDGGGVGSVSYWQDFANSLTPAQIIDSAGGTFASNCTIGTRENPQVTLLTDETDIGTHVSGTVDGAGILIVNGDLQITGTFHFEGLVIVISDGNLVVTGTGRSITYGSVVLAGSGVSSEVDYGGHASIRYSSQGLDYADDTLAGLSSWREM